MSEKKTPDDKQNRTLKGGIKLAFEYIKNLDKFVSHDFVTRDYLKAKDIASVIQRQTKFSLQQEQYRTQTDNLVI